MVSVDAESAWSDPATPGTRRRRAFLTEELVGLNELADDVVRNLPFPGCQCDQAFAVRDLGGKILTQSGSTRGVTSLALLWAMSCNELVPADLSEMWGRGWSS